MQWDEYETNLVSTFAGLRREEHFTDVTLVSEDGHLFKAHKVILFASSLILDTILKSQDHPKPLIFLGGASKDTLSSLLNFIYFGKVELTTGDQLDKFMALANKLKVKGLSNDENPANGKDNEHIEDKNKDELEAKESEWSKRVKKHLERKKLVANLPTCRRDIICKHTTDVCKCENCDPDTVCKCCKCDETLCKCYLCKRVSQKNTFFSDRLPS